MLVPLRGDGVLLHLCERLLRERRRAREAGRRLLGRVRAARERIRQSKDVKELKP